MPHKSSSKATLRRHFLKLRKEVPLPEQTIASEKASEIFLKNIPVHKDDIVSAYYPTNGEINPLPLLERLSAYNIVTSLPVIKDKNHPLEFHIWQQGNQLYDDKLFGLKEPKGKIVVPTIIIVPLLAFDDIGHRLGYGGGFYDRTLIAMKQSSHKFISVGYAYSFQQTSPLPIHDDDHMLDYIVTEKAIIKFK